MQCCRWAEGNPVVLGLSDAHLIVGLSFFRHCLPNELDKPERRQAKEIERKRTSAVKRPLLGRFNLEREWLKCVSGLTKPRRPVRSYVSILKTI